MSKVALLVGGDLHLHADSVVCDDTRCIPQLITSGVTSGSTTVAGWHLFLFQVLRCIMELTIYLNLNLIATVLHLRFELIKIDVVDLLRLCILGFCDAPTLNDRALHLHVSCCLLYCFLSGGAASDSLSC